MKLKFTQFSQEPAVRSVVCSRCGYRMFQTKRFQWLCGPGCDGAQQWHDLKNTPSIPQTLSVNSFQMMEDCLDQARN